MQVNSLQSIAAVTLDAEGTLIHPYPSVGAVYAEILTDHGIIAQASHLERAFREAFLAAKSDRRKKVCDRSELEFWRRVVRDALAGFDCKGRFEVVFDDLYREFGSARRWQIVEDGIPTIRSLKDRGYLVCMLSNWDSRLRTVLGELHLEELFDNCFISCEIGYEKPDRRIFRHVERALFLRPDQILHVGNSPEHDAVGAAGAGWEYLIVQKREGLALEDQHRISSLGDVLKRLPLKARAN
jgi:putative hydrolase of the HAD superfamily